MQNLINIYHVVQELLTFPLAANGRNWCSANLVHQKVGLVFKWLGNVVMQMYEKFDQNIPCGFRVMDIFTNC